MIKKYLGRASKMAFCAVIFSISFINTAQALDMSGQSMRPIRNMQPTIIPSPPIINAKSYVLMDANSGKIIAEKNMSVKTPPASLTKLMTLYLISKSLQNQTIRLEDKVLINKKAWQMGGSKMFVKVGSNVLVKDLIQGIVVDSGNDSCVAMAEYIAGSEDAFASMMNAQAKALGMQNTHYTDSTGMPHPQHYTTAYDLAILSRALIRNFPQDYEWYKQKWFTYNNIKQPNRNRLLWRYLDADGIKTGHTDTAGYCLVASAEKNGMRLISVVMGTPSDEARSDDSIKLLTYGFRFFTSHMVAAPNSTLAELRVWGGQAKTVPAGLDQTLYITTPRGQFSKLKIVLQPKEKLTSPIKKEQNIGQLDLVSNDKSIASYPLIALKNIPKGGIWRRSTDWITHIFSGWFGSTAKPQEITLGK